MSEEERLKLENELLLTKSKAQMINMYLDSLSIIKEIRETLNDKRSILTTHLFNGSYCNYEELLYQVDEEIRKILDKGDSNE